MAARSPVHQAKKSQDEAAQLSAFPLIVMLVVLLLSPFVYDLHQWSLQLFGGG